MDLSINLSKLCFNPNHTYITIEKCKSYTKDVVIVEKNCMNRKQLIQVMSEPKVFIPKIKIKFNESVIIDKDLNIKQIIGKPFVRNRRFKTNALRNTNNNSLKESNSYGKQKRRLNTKTNDFQRSKTINHRNGGNQEMAKENNNCNQQLSRVFGLPNLGNTCYLNSIIQVLRITPGFTQFICFLNQTITSNTNKNTTKLVKENKDLIICLHELFVHLANKLNIDFNNSYKNIGSKVESLINCRNMKERFEFGQQHDSHEFFNWLITELNQSAEVLFPTKATKELNNLNTRSGHKFERRITFLDFQGVMLRNIKCSECERSSVTDDSFADIQIPLCFNEESIDENESGNITKISSMQSFTDYIHRTDYLKDDNLFDCNNCSKKTVASVMNSIKISPKILVIFIKKPLEYSETSKKSKCARKIFKVPLHLEYSSNDNSIGYDLYSFVMHSGSINNGHYYSVINSELQNQSISTRKTNCSCALTIQHKFGWIKVNDNKVRHLDPSHVIKLLEDEDISSTPYLAFYRKNV